MRSSESIKEIASALCKAQAVIEGAIKDKMNPAFRSAYADLGSCWDACREPLSTNGLSIIQLPKADDGAVILETILMHTSGEYISEELRIPVVKRDAQGYGSALTYARRYALCSFVGIAPEDDDGEDTKKHGGTEGKKKEEPKAAPEECSKEKFSDNTAAWREIILSKKKTPAGLVAFLGTRLTLTEEQKLTIDAWSHEGDQ